MKKKIAIIAPACAISDDAKGSIEANQKLGVADVEFIPGNESGLSYGHVNPEFPTTRRSTEQLPADSALARSNAIINAVYQCEADGLWSLDGGNSADQVAMLLTEYAKNPKNYIEKYNPTDLDPELKSRATKTPGFTQKYPKALPYLISYSNNTHIQQALSKHGFPVIYGANASQNEPTEDRKAALELFAKPAKIDLAIKASHRLEEPIKGVAQIGVIDNLVTDIGTENQLIPAKDGILFIESISDIDKFISMTNELKVAGCLDGLNAIVVGKTMTDADDSVINKKLDEFFGDSWPPIVYAPKFGHMNGKTPIQAFGDVTIDNGKISIDANELKVRDNLSAYKTQVQKIQAQNSKKPKQKKLHKKLILSSSAEDIELQAVIIMADISNKVRSGKISANTDVKIILSTPSIQPKDAIDGLSDFVPIAFICTKNGKPKFDEYGNLTFSVNLDTDTIHDCLLEDFKKAGLLPKDLIIANSENGGTPKITIVKESHEKIISASTAKRAHEIEMAKAIINEGVQTFKVASGNNFKTHIEIYDHLLQQQCAAINLKKFMTTAISVSPLLSNLSGPTRTPRKSWEI